jgi:hypothetical protein
LVETKNNKARKITIEAVPLMSEGENHYFLVLFSEENIEAKESLLNASKDKRVKATGR